MVPLQFHITYTITVQRLSDRELDGSKGLEKKPSPPPTENYPGLSPPFPHTIQKLNDGGEGLQLGSKLYVDRTHVKCVSGPFLSPRVPPGQSPLVLTPGVWLKAPKHLHTAAYVGQCQHDFQ